MKRLNQDTNKPYVLGEYNPDTGLYFRSYVKTILKANGYFKEAWLSEGVLNNFLDKQKLAARKCQLKRTEENKKWIDDYKMSKGCVNCGYKQHASALDFDHIDRESKSFTIGSRTGGLSKKRLAIEMKKCQILCANCHRIKTFENNEHGRIIGDDVLNIGTIQSRIVKAKEKNMHRSKFYTSKTKSKLKNVYLSKSGLYFVRKQTDSLRECVGYFDNIFDAACCLIGGRNRR
ncbi:hypothetical protein NFB56_16025 [Yersinia ruckeri]|uniref:hypothetical protein n=1 Tax=Yersinia ruckeri TaxID=29486 RepID=UPI002238B4E2|nr:hypothetical protein [Yersinia ruckeri]MCW6550346.1 hypothetical protein [Yersinia ruckeri]